MSDSIIKLIGEDFVQALVERNEGMRMDAKLINWENSLIKRFYVCRTDLYPTYYLELDGYDHGAYLFLWIHELHYITGIRVVIVGERHCDYGETLDVLDYNYEDGREFDPKQFTGEGDRLKLLLTFPDTHFYCGSGFGLADGVYGFCGMELFEKRGMVDVDYKDLIRELSGHALAAFMRKQKWNEQKLYEVIDQMDAVVKMEIDPESYVVDDD